MEGSVVIQKDGFAKFCKTVFLYSGRMYFGQNRQILIMKKFS